MNDKRMIINKISRIRKDKKQPTLSDTAQLNMQTILSCKCLTNERKTNRKNKKLYTNSVYRSVTMRMKLLTRLHSYVWLTHNNTHTQTIHTQGIQIEHWTVSRAWVVSLKLKTNTNRILYTRANRTTFSIFHLLNWNMHVCMAAQHDICVPLHLKTAACESFRCTYKDRACHCIRFLFFFYLHYIWLRGMLHVFVRTCCSEKLKSHKEFKSIVKIYFEEPYIRNSVYGIWKMNVERAL